MQALLDEAKSAHSKGNLDKARVLYESLAASASGDPLLAAEAMHGMGVSLMQGDRSSKDSAAEALKYIDQAARACPTVPRFQNSLGIVLEKLGRADDALAAFQKAVDLQPENTKWIFNYAKAAKALKNYTLSLDCMKRILALHPKHPEIYYKIGSLYKAMDKTSEAVEWFRRQLDVEPTHNYAKFWIAALTGEGQADAFKPHMVARLFDSYADSFDHHLQGLLGYRTPEVLTDLLQSAARGAGLSVDASPSSPRPFRRCCDLGCGTGLMGPLLRARVDRLEGVDLSSGMIDRAKTRKVYDYLHVGEIVAYLDASRTASQAAAGTTPSAELDLARLQLEEGPAAAPGPSGQYDLLIAADVLVYIADLAPLFQSAAQSAAPSGSLFAFSTEKLGEEDAAPGGAGYLLRPTGRYAHRQSYVQRTLREAGWEVVAAKTTEIRQNLGAPVIGDLVVARLGKEEACGGMSRKG